MRVEVCCSSSSLSRVLNNIYVPFLLPLLYPVLFLIGLYQSRVEGLDYDNKFDMFPIAYTFGEPRVGDKG